MMRRVLRALGSAIGILLIVSVVLSFSMWFLGGYLAFGETRPFESTLGRIVGLGVMWILTLVLILIILLSRRKKDDAMANEIVESNLPSSANMNQEVVSEELADMQGKLRTALKALRRSKTGRMHLYELPWYVIIGPPGAGKTTAIVNSGLNFPLAEELGQGAIGGVGGTRNCDWWFTDAAVLVDTAGRYTTQESDAEADNAAWLGFLKLLKKYRTRQPINGAIVAISLSDLALQDELTQKNHAAAIRRRLQELRERLGVRFPVYVLFTKADLIAGFNEYFEPLGKEARGQVWGFTLPLSTARTEASPIERFDDEQAALLSQLNNQSLERLQNESDPQRRSLIAGFPMQLAAIQPVARAFLDELFLESRYEHRQNLRGVYFTSGTQEGTPIDRLMMGMARNFGIGRQAIGSGRGTGRSYFLTRLFQDVIFGESGLVSADDKVEFRYRWTRRLAIVATVGIVAVFAGLWSRSYIGNYALLEASEDQIQSYRQTAAVIPGSPVGDTDLPAIIPSLNTLRDLGADPTTLVSLEADQLGWGLYSADVVENSARQSYRRSLNRHFLPRLLLRLEEQMQGNIENPEFLYEALKIYLSLGLVGPMNADQIKEWMELDWQWAYPGPNREGQRQDLAGHLDVLLSAPMDKIDLNSDLVKNIQDVLTRMPQSQRVYKSIINSPESLALPQWRLTEIGGPALTRAMVRSSGKPLNEGIEGIFTYRGFHEVFLVEALEVASRIQRDSWVLGGESDIAQSAIALQAITRDVLDLYYNDYIARYDQILGDIDIIPMESLGHAVEVTNVLSGPTSPIVNVLSAIATETNLTASPEKDAPTEGLQSGAAAVAAVEGRRRMSMQAQLFVEAMGEADDGSGTAKKLPGEYVTERFAWLHDMVQPQDGQPSQLDQMMDTLTEVYQGLNKLSFAGGIASPNDENSALVRFQAASGRFPGPLKRWSKQITVGSSGIAADGTRAGINAAWQSQVLPFCEQVVGSAYPFNRRSKADVNLRDFASLFGPGGQIDAFFTKNLVKHVDMRARPWTWKKSGTTDLGISQNVLTQFQRAAQIRSSFFPSGGEARIQFQVTPEALDPKASSILLEIDGQQIGFNQKDGQPRPVAVSWPGQVGFAQIAFFPDQKSSESIFRRDGPWALFRLLDAAEVRKTNVADRKRIIFRIGGRIAIFQLQSGSVHNPFSLASLAKFKCPKTF